MPRFLPVAQIDDFFRFTEIDAPGQFPDDQDIEPFDDIGFQRGGAGQRRIADGGPQIGEKLHVLAQPQQARFRAHIIVDMVPFRATNGAEQHGIGGHRARHVILRDGRAMGVMGCTTDQPVFDLKTGLLVLVHGVDEFFHFRHGFRADTVARQEEKMACRHGQVLSQIRDEAASCQSRGLPVKTL